MKIINFKRFQLPFGQFNVCIMFMVAMAGVYILSAINPQVAAENIITSIPTLMEGKIWTLITHIFYNNSVWSLIFYGVWILFFGMAIERAIGSWRFLLIYIGGGVVSAIIIMLIGLALGIYFPVASTITASMCMNLAFACFFADQQISLYFVIPIRAVFLPLISLGLSLLLSLGSAGVGLFYGVIGFIVGYLIMLIFFKRNYFKMF